MKLSNRAYKLFRIFDTVLVLALIALTIIVTSSYTYPDEQYYMETMMMYKRIVTVGLIVSLVSTIAIKWISNDANEEITYLYNKLNELEKKLEDKKDN